MAPRDLFLKDRLTGDVQRVNRYPDGSETAVDIDTFDMDNTARYFAFGTKEDLLGDGAGAINRVYHYDLAADALTLASVDGAGLPAVVFSSTTRISGEGRYVLYNRGSSSSLWRFDADTGDVIEVSTDSTGQSGNFSSRHGDLSNDGQLAVFTSSASNLVTGDKNGSSDAFVKDLVSGAITRISVTDSGAELAFGSACGISGDGGAGFFFVHQPRYRRRTGGADDTRCVSVRTGKRPGDFNDDPRWRSRRRPQPVRRGGPADAGGRVFQ